MTVILAVVGMPGCGKGELSAVVEEMGLPVFSMGDMIRAEVSARGLEGDPHVFGRVAQELRDEFGYGVLAERLCPHISAAAESSRLVLIEGMRGTDEEEVFRDHLGDRFQVIGVHCDADLRFARISLRGRAEDGSRSAFDARDERESSWGVRELLKSADHRLDNNSGLAEFRESVQTLLGALLPLD